MPSNSKINVFKKHPAMVLQHSYGKSIKEEASKFKVNIVDETIELPSNTPKNRATRNIDDNDAFELEEKLLEKVELRKGIGRFEATNTVIKFKNRCCWHWKSHQQS